jgi:hypothetical protein
LIRSASATDDPPNFWTTSGAGIGAFYPPRSGAPPSEGSRQEIGAWATMR